MKTGRSSAVFECIGHLCKEICTHRRPPRSGLRPYPATKTGLLP